MPDSMPQTADSAEPRRVRGRWALLVAGVAGAALLAVVLRGGRGPEPQAEAPRPAAQPKPAADPDERRRADLVGTWEDDYQGRRTMTLAADGTGTMVVELSGWRAALSAPRLRFDMLWSVEGGQLKKRTVGGEPAAQVQMILKTMGDRVAEPIVELSRDRLLLLDQDGKTKYDWRRARK